MTEARVPHWLTSGEYPTTALFLEDVDLIASNALEYNPVRGALWNS
jgi:hypothetical protein